MIPEQLQTENLFMRPFAVTDGSAVHAYWRSDPGWERFNESVPSDFTEKDANNFVVEMSSRDRNDQPSWVLVHSNTVVGVVSLSFEEGHRAASIGYGVHAGLRGRGLCVEAVTKILDSAFSESPELDEIRAYTDPRNNASIRVLKKLGFSEDRHLGNEGRTFCLPRDGWRTKSDA